MGCRPMSEAMTDIAETHGEVGFAADAAHVAVAIAGAVYRDKHALIPGLIGQWTTAEITLTRYNRLVADDRSIGARTSETVKGIKLQLGHALGKLLTETGAVDGLKIDFRTRPDEAAILVSWRGCRGNMADGGLAIRVEPASLATRGRARTA